MYPSDFDYYRAASVAEASELLKAHPGAKLLAGGHSLIPLLKLRLTAPTALVDIGRIANLRGVSVSAGSIRVGALTTHAELAASAAVKEHCPALAEAARQVGDPAVRNRGTIGGNVAHADPASDLPTVLAALDATFVIEGSGGTRTMGAGEFFVGIMTTALAGHELLTAIEIPVKRSGQGMAYVKFPHPASRYAVIGVAAAVTARGGTCTSAAIALGGLVPKAVRAGSVENALIGRELTGETIAKAAALVAADLGSDILGDLYASAEYRKAVAPVWVKRAITAATPS
jgi:carbon-monoxide dehydrogenase medium subunit